MKFNIANPVTGCQISRDITDESRLKMIIDKSLASELEGQLLATELDGYVFKISGGSDKQGFGMKQGVLTRNRVKLLMSPGDSCFRGHGHRRGERRRKSVRGCVVSPDVAALNLVIVKQGDKHIPGLTDKETFVSRGPKRGSKVCKLFRLTSGNDEVISFAEALHSQKIRNITQNTKNISKYSKVTRLLCPLKLQRTKAQLARMRKKLPKTLNSEALRHHERLISLLRKSRLKNLTLLKKSSH
eukprot:gnl/MRDRNA2_/MRDRNA2_60109_c0_seq1.p1 gnl/MRDRNA2_/MRDRNA2_60109_c0~~gnl/MRDRNA2_/MRDRNA2_60109_c0_seq1.p1  ORF type:complete len:243 (-),score=4.19 gnl/MRDRNA2_/MRDRNA2_60109_c0_seq1:27-755(-)